MTKSEFKDCDVYAARCRVCAGFHFRFAARFVRTRESAGDYIATLEKAGRMPAPFVRFIRDRVCETQKELLRLMGQSIALDDEGVKSVNDEGVNEGVKAGASNLKSQVLLP